MYEIAIHGSSSKVPYCTMGSGTLAAMSVLREQCTTGVLTEKVRNIKLGGKGGEEPVRD